MKPKQRPNTNYGNVRINKSCIYTFSKNQTNSQKGGGELASERRGQSMGKRRITKLQLNLQLLNDVLHHFFFFMGTTKLDGRELAGSNDGVGITDCLLLSWLQVNRAIVLEIVTVRWAEATSTSARLNSGRQGNSLLAAGKATSQAFALWRRAIAADTGRRW